MIDFEHLTYSYPDGSELDTAPSSDRANDKAGGVGASVSSPVLQDVCLHIEEGEFVLVVGPSGAGKSTLLRCLNGLVPHLYGGAISGRVRVAGRDPIDLEPRRMNDVVGFVFQDPEAQAVVDVVEDELAFAMENQGLPLPTMRKRVEEVLDQLNIAPLRQRPLSTLSGGERQRVAIASVLTLHPQVLVLDEPTSQLDPQAAEEVLDTLVKLNRDLGLTVLLSEHRLERVVEYADRVLYMPGLGEPPLIGEPRQILSRLPFAPPLIELGKALGWSPLPLTLKEARHFARGLEVPGSGLQVSGSTFQVPGSRLQSGTRQAVASVPSTQPQEVVLEVRSLRFAYNGSQTLRGIDLTVRRGEFVALMGRNGVGKSTLLRQCIGLLKPDQGQVSVLGMDTRHTPVETLGQRVGYVPQNPNALLFADTIDEELAFTRRARGMPHGDDSPLLEALSLSAMRQRYPRDLSAGERQRAALAAVLVGDPQIILLDEPTRGLDYLQKASLIAFLLAQKQSGKTIILATHDVELVAQCAERVVLMGEGEIVVDGPVREVMSDSQVFASQINKLLRDPRYLTVQDVMAALR
jgi:energy-coupling factor transporter ATP-binding protein EcfA2